MATVTNGSQLPNSNLSLQPSDLAAQIDNLISLHLHLWPALTAAIQNAWGVTSPADGEDKRAWLAGAISDMFTQNQLRDIEDLEDVLGQVMSDEFELVVDDGSIEEVAQKIWSGRARLLKGDTSEVAQLMALWEERSKKGKQIAVNVVQGQDVDQETDDEEDAETWNGFEDNPSRDVEMNDAPSLVDLSRNQSEPKKKAEPEVDEDGFTKVVKKNKR